MKNDKETICFIYVKDNSKIQYEISKLSVDNSGLIIRTDQLKIRKNSRALSNNQIYIM